MRCIYLCILFILLSFQTGFSQVIPLQFKLIDKESQEPISSAHIFISDSSIGSISDEQGNCVINVSPHEHQTIIISHLAYDTYIIEPSKYLKSKESSIIKLNSNGVDLNQIQITSQRSKKWKQNLKKFKEALLGAGKPASKCKIVNPEVLRFNNDDGKFTVTAVDALEIDNDYLGYNIKFWLENLTIESNGSKFYKGNGQFIDSESSKDKKRQKRRAKHYKNSLAHFLHSLLVSESTEALKEKGYQIALERYVNGNFKSIVTPDSLKFIQKDPKSRYYQLHFSEFLTVKHLNLKTYSPNNKQVSISNAEQQKFGTNRQASIESKSQAAISRLYKIEPYIKFDIHGNIINKSAIREYGFWADQGLATTLPIDYKKYTDVERPMFLTNSIDSLVVLKNLVGNDSKKREQALETIRNNYSSRYLASLLDILKLSNHNWHQEEIKNLIKEKHPDLVPEYFEGMQWIWKNNLPYGGFYGDIKAHLYSTIDPAFHDYFYNRENQSRIRLDEIVWGGVRQDGIPPLHSPTMISATNADYLDDTNIIFGIVIDGKAYAYPKRILAWHEFFTDKIENHSIAGVYCTLCGTVIIYNSEFNGVKHDLGTSGFLYRSNKLMYDRATQSLWNTIWGKPILGPLADQNIQLETFPVETSTWGQWKKTYPDTKVLSIETGFNRDYSEGQAYKDYFDDDVLMFPVAKKDTRLANKARVFIPRPQNYEKFPLAISIDFLVKRGIYQDRIGEQNILVITEENGASRAFEIKDQQFTSYNNRILLDNTGQKWKVTDHSLIDQNGNLLSRLPAHEAFWFGWLNAYPDTRIIY